jgi:hypothetical protein
MILADSGPLVALFDAHDQHHGYCRRVLSTVDEELWTTVPALTEAFHLLRPGSPGPRRLTEFITNRGLAVLPLDDQGLRRSFEMMIQYSDIPMDFADATIVSAAEQLGTDKVFTLDFKHFTTYRIRRGYHRVPFTIIGDTGGPRVVRECVSVEESAAVS